MGSQYNGISNNESATPPAAVNIVSSTNASPIVVDATAHGLTTGDWVQVVSHQTNNAANGKWSVVVVDANHVQLAGSTGNGVGGATGTIQSLVFGATYQIPSDGDARSAASVNVALEALGDRTAFALTNFGSYKLLSLWGTQTDENTENVDWLAGAGATNPIGAASTWTSIAGIASPPAGILAAGDVIDCEFSFSIQWADSGTTTEGFLLALGAGFSVAGSLPGSSTKIAGSGQVVPVAQINTTRTGMVLRGRVTVPANVQTCELFLYAYTRNATPHDISFTAPGDFAMVGHIWRPTSFVNRTG
jgi:hypothetical protein